MRVLKFGGKSLSTVERFDEIASKLSTQNMNKTIIVVSAMGNTTNELFKMASVLNGESSKREQDMLLTSGERISAALMSMALEKYGISAQSFTGSQAGIMTSGPHSDADIKEVKPIRIHDCLEKKIVPVIAGFQGVDPELKDVTTLGRGGTDLTAVALADHFRGHVEFYKSVGGVFTADPTICPEATPIKEIDHKFLSHISQWGAKVIHEKAATMAEKAQVKLKFLDDKSFEEKTKTSKQIESLFALCILDSIATLKVNNKEISSAISYLNTELNGDNCPNWKILASAYDNESSRFILRTDSEKKEQLINKIESLSLLEILETDLNAVSAVFSESPEKERIRKLFDSTSTITTRRLLETSNRYTFFILKKDTESFIKNAHKALS